MIKGDIPELDKAGLRKFGLMTGSIAAVLFGLFIPWVFDRAYLLWPWVLAAILTVWAIVLPATLTPLYRGWMRVGLILGSVNTHIILFLLYYLVFFPIGLWLKLLGKDPMKQVLTPSPNDSYRVISKKRDCKHFERPY